MNPIVGIGELLWDVFPDGWKVAGGAPFNFAFHCKQLGHDAVIVSRVGDDDLGRELREEVKRLGMSDAFIQTDYAHATGTVVVHLGDAGQPAYSISVDGAWDCLAWDSSLNRLARSAPAVCFGTLAQRSPTSRKVIEAFVRQVRGLRVFDVNLRERADTDAIRAAIFESDWIKLNQDEVTAVCEIFDKSLAELIGLHCQIKPGANCVWIRTSGEHGVEINTRSEEWHELGVPARVVDTVGAGDAFTAAMVCLHLEGRPLRECARFANHYAARVCEHQGATPRIDRAEVECAAL